MIPALMFLAGSAVTGIISVMLVRNAIADAEAIHARASKVIVTLIGFCDRGSTGGVARQVAARFDASLADTPHNVAFTGEFRQLTKEDFLPGGLLPDVYMRGESL